MKDKQQVLCLEDNEFDYELIRNSLVEAGLPCALRRVETRDEFIGALEDGRLDLILAGGTFPSFDGSEALKIARVRCPGVPFIFVAGSIGEDKAVESLESGATDYIQKDQLKRLAPAVRRALNEAREKAECDRAKECEITLRFLRLANESTHPAGLVRAVATFFQEHSGCEAVGVRLRAGGDYPYFEARGFPEEFIQMENSLCLTDSCGRPVTGDSGNPVLACMCGNVICGRFDPSKPFFTAQGSFWTNSTSELLSKTTEEDRQTRTRNRCHGEGYESVALIPLGTAEQRLGLLQLNDRRRGVFSSETIALWERLAGYLSVALSKCLMEEELSRKEEGYQSLFENMLEGFAYCRMLYEDDRPCDFVYLAVNKAFEQLTGLKDVVGRKVSEVLPGIRETHPELFTIYGGVLSTGRPKRFETYSALFGGWLDIAVYKSEKDCFIAVFGNITERKQKEYELGKLNRTLQAKSRISQAMSRAEDEQGYLNAACRVIVEDCGHALVWIGYAEENEAKSVRPVAHAGFEAGYLETLKITWADTDRGWGPVGTAIRTGKASIFRVTDAAFAPWREEAMKHGYAAVVAVPLMTDREVFGSLNIYDRDRDPFSADEVQLLSEIADDLSCGIGAIRMKTARARLEQSLIEEKAFTENALNSLKDIVFVFDLEGKFLRWNRSLSTVTGYSNAEIASMQPTDFFRGKDVGRVAAALQKVAGKGVAAVEAAIVTKDGRRIPYEFTGSLLWDRKGKPSGVSGVGRDISERVAAEAALRESEEKYRRLVDTSPVGVYKASLEGRFLFVNRALADIFEFDSPEEMMSESALKRYKDPEERTALVDALKRDGQVRNYELYTLSKAGKPIHLLVNATIEGETISGMVLNITEQKKLETQLRYAQKMEAVGTLAGGMAHDFNNILNVIMGFGALALKKMDEGHPSVEYLNEVLASAEKAVNLTQRLLTFSRKRSSDMKAVDVNDLVKCTEKMVATIIGEDIELITELTQEMLPATADVGQLEQVLMNLASNARDAMPRGGSLMISTGIMELSDEFIAAHGYGTPGHYALISFTDTGIGMSEDTQKKIFEPFFTTKAVGEGTGLGLSIAYGIVKSHKGFINVYSEPGQGTTFKILIPLLEEPLRTGKEAEAGPSQRRIGTETVLVAEDDVSVRKLTRIILESAGYRVIAAGDGEDAVAKFNDNRDALQLVILDMIMPKKSGREAYEAIRKIRPGIKVLFMSGYTMDIISKRELLADGMHCIFKPVSPKELLKKVREVLTQ